MSMLRILISCAALFATVIGCADLTPDLSVLASGKDRKAAIYGVDDRVDIYDASPFWSDIGIGSVAAMMFPDNLYMTSSGRIALNVYTLGEAYEDRLCHDVPFQDQPLASSCSATLIDHDLVLTAGHCVSPCPGLKFVFDYYQESASGLAEINPSDVFDCSEVLVARYDDEGRDYAIIRLARSAGQRQPAVASRYAPNLDVGTSLTLIGFPSGLPMKVAENGEVSHASTHNNIDFSAYVDAFTGNSGSGVFDSSGRVVGVLSGGADDYVNAGSCIDLERYPERGYGERVVYAYPAIEELCNTGYPSEALCNQAPVCGDGICSNGETETSCADDCNWVNWTCDRNYYNADDGCDCGCGSYDPDCRDSTQEIFGCADGQGCNLSGYCDDNVEPGQVPVEETVSAEPDDASDIPEENQSNDAVRDFVEEFEQDDDVSPEDNEQQSSDDDDDNDDDDPSTDSGADDEENRDTSDDEVERQSDETAKKELSQALSLGCQTTAGGHILPALLLFMNWFRRRDR